MRASAPATAAMTDDTIALFSLFSVPAVAGKKVTAAFDGGRLYSDGGVMLLSMAERRLGVAERLARCIPDRRDRSRIAHTPQAAQDRRSRVKWTPILGPEVKLESGRSV